MSIRVCAYFVCVLSFIGFEAEAREAWQSFDSSKLPLTQFQSGESTKQYYNQLNTADKLKILKKCSGDKADKKFGTSVRTSNWRFACNRFPFWANPEAERKVLRGISTTSHSNKERVVRREAKTSTNLSRTVSNHRDFVLPGGAVLRRSDLKTASKSEYLQLHARCVDPVKLNNWVQELLGVKEPSILSRIFTKDQAWFGMQLWHRDSAIVAQRSSENFDSIATLADLDFNWKRSERETFISNHNLGVSASPSNTEAIDLAIKSSFCNGSAKTLVKSFASKTDKFRESKFGELALSFAMARDSKPGVVFDFADALLSTAATIVEGFNEIQVGPYKIRATNLSKITEKNDAIKSVAQTITDINDDAKFYPYILELDDKLANYSIYNKNGDLIFEITAERKDRLLPEVEPNSLAASGWVTRFVNTYDMRNTKVIKDAKILADFEAFMRFEGGSIKDLTLPQLEQKCLVVGQALGFRPEISNVDRYNARFAFSLANYNSGNDPIPLEKWWRVSLCMGKSAVDELNRRGVWKQTYEEALQQSGKSFVRPSIGKIFSKVSIDKFGQNSRILIANAVDQLKQYYPNELTVAQGTKVDDFFSTNAHKLRSADKMEGVIAHCSPLRDLVGQILNRQYEARQGEMAMILVLLARNSMSDLEHWKLASCLHNWLPQLIDIQQKTTFLQDALKSQQEFEQRQIGDAAPFGELYDEMEVLRDTFSDLIGRDASYHLRQKALNGGPLDAVTIYSVSDSRDDAPKAIDDSLLKSVLKDLKEIRGNNNQLGMGCYHRIKRCRENVIRFKISGDPEQPMLMGVAEFNGSAGSLDLEHLSLRRAQTADCEELKHLFRKDSECRKSKPWEHRICGGNVKARAISICPN